MQQSFPNHPRPGLGGTARDLAALAFEAFEVLAERQYRAPWAVPARRTTRPC